MTAFLKGEEAWLIAPGHLDKLVRASDVTEAVEAIKDTDIGKYLDTVLITTFDEADRALWGYLEFCLKRIERFDLLPKDMKKVTAVYMEKFDVQNIKAAFEGSISGKKPALIPLGTIYSSGMSGDLAKAADAAAISTILDECGLKDYAAILADYRAGSDVMSRMMFETALDRKYYDRLIGVARKSSDGKALVKAVGTSIDMRNIKTMLRGNARGNGADSLKFSVGNGYLLTEKDLEQLSAVRFEDLSSHVPYAYQKLVQEVVTSYAKAKRITVIEDIVDRYELATVKSAIASKLMSPIMIVWYLILKENEVRNMRLVLRAIFDKVPVEEIRDYLVMKA